MTDDFRRDACLASIRAAQRQLYRDILFALIGCIIVMLVMIFGAGRAHAAGWCGNYARHHLAVADPGREYNLACNWRNYGSPTYAHEGAFVVWCSRHHHHVGKITGACNGNLCLVKSGNDGHRVRERMRSVAGASFRE